MSSAAADGAGGTGRTGGAGGTDGADGTGASGTAQARRAGRLFAVNAGACALLLAQYLLGMAVNVYVALPGRHPGAGARDYFSGAVSGLGWVISDGPGWAAAHAAFGLALEPGSTGPASWTTGTRSAR